jgi:flagellin
VVSLLGNALSLRLARSLNTASQNLGQSLYRLSTGNRINSPQDGAAEFSQIINLQSQARGLDRASQNAVDAQGLTTAASTSLEQMLSLAYSLRELALEATSTELTTSQREDLATEAAGLLSDLSALATGTTYNGFNLLDGSFTTTTVQTSITGAGGVDFSIGNARTTQLGRLAIYESEQNFAQGPLGGLDYLRLNGVLIGGSLDDGISITNPNESALSFANAINAKTNETNVSATATTEVTITFSDQGTFTGELAAGEFLINGVSITGTDLTTTGALAAAVNSQSSSTGVTAALDDSGNVVLTAADGRNVDIAFSNGATNNFYDWIDVSESALLFVTGVSNFAAGASVTRTGAIRLVSSEAITVAAETEDIIGVLGTISLDSSTAVQYINLNSSDNAELALETLDATIAQIESLSSQVGAVHSRLDMAASSLLAQSIATEEAANNIAAVDVAEETARAVYFQLLQDSSVASLMQANLSRLTVARLLEDLPKF